MGINQTLVHLCFSHSVQSKLLWRANPSTCKWGHTSTWLVVSLAMIVMQAFHFLVLLHGGQSGGVSHLSLLEVLLPCYIPCYIPWLLLKRDKSWGELSLRTKLFATEIKIFDQQEPCLMTSSLAAFYPHLLTRAHDIVFIKNDVIHSCIWILHWPLPLRGHLDLVDDSWEACWSFWSWLQAFLPKTHGWLASFPGQAWEWG